MNKMNKVEKAKIRTVTISDRGQIVVPEDIRNELSIKAGSTLVLIKRGGEIVLRKESDVMRVIDDEERFWKAISRKSLESSWSEEDDMWDNIFKEGV